MTNVHPVTENDLHAYVDQRLDPARHAQVEAYLAAHPEAATQVLIYREQKTLLRNAFDPVLAEPIPKHMLKARSRRWGRPQLLAVAASLTMGVSIGWWVHGETALKKNALLVSLPMQATVAHAVYTTEVLHPVEVGADQQDHLVKWLSKRLNKPLHAPVLQHAGYQLEGGRLLPGNSGPAAQFMYRDSAGQRLTLYLRKALAENSDTAFRYARESGVSVFYWVDGDMAYALSGDIAREKLLIVADAVYRDLMK
ncbi:MAG: anti-sigma factor [Pseudomonadota bacterium]